MAVMADTKLQARLSQLDHELEVQSQSMSILQYMADYIHRY